jgi:hypothetical protein
VKIFHPRVDQKVGSQRTMIKDLGYLEREFHIEVIYVKEEREHRQP